MPRLLERAILWVAFCLVTQMATAAPREMRRIPTILVLGDSLSDGFALKRSEAYPALLGDKLREAGLPFDVVNASATGDTTEGGLRRLPPHLKGKVDIFILELGVNDAFRGVSIDKIRDNLQEIIDQVKQRHSKVRVVIVGMQLPNSSSDDYLGAFERMYADLAARNHAALVPSLLEGVVGDLALNLPDHFHPNAAGHKILAENVWRVLEPVAREVAAELNVGGALVPRPSGN